MWERIRRELLIEYYWWKRQSGRKRNLDSPFSLLGIMCTGIGIIILVLMGQTFASVYRNMIPIVNGAQVADAYWSSLAFALKFSLMMILLFVTLVLSIIFRFTRRKK